MANLVFDTLSTPVGLAFDAGGNFYLSSLDSPDILPGIPSLIPTISKFDPNGTLLGTLESGFLTPTYLEYSTELDRLFSLDTNGILDVIDPNTLAVTTQVNLTQLATEVSAVYDVAIGGLNNFSGLIQPALSTFGDFDVILNGNTLEFYITGQSAAQAFPFVLKVDWELGVGITDSQVILSSTADALSIAPQTPRLTRGIAVNSQGTILTTLPLPTSTSPIDVPVAFDVNFDPGDGVISQETPTILNQVDVYSQGLTTDALGNFYIATNSVGSAQFGVAGEGALIVVSSDLNQTFFAQGINAPLSSFRDVAVNPVNNLPFTTVDTFTTSAFNQDDDLLVSFPEAILVNPNGITSQTTTASAASFNSSENLLTDDLEFTTTNIIGNGASENNLVSPFPEEDLFSASSSLNNETDANFI